MGLKYFFDLMSQPSRALYIFFKLTNVPFEPCTVALRKGEHMTEEFKGKYNKFQKVPFIHDGDLKLTESVAIVRYVASKHNVDKLYPKEAIAQAKVDEYLEWQHLNTRAFCALYFQKKWLQPLITGKELSAAALENHKNNMVACIDKIEELWLDNGKKAFLCGDKLTVADIFAACELEQPKVAGFNPFDEKERPILYAWFKRVQAETNPVYDEAHKILNKMSQMSKENILAKL